MEELKIDISETNRGKEQIIIKKINIIIHTLKRINQRYIDVPNIKL